MGALTESAEAQFRSRYESWDDPDIPKFHYGTHYSSAAFVLNYLVRLEPFTQHFIAFQGGHFDHPDRMFHSLPMTWDLLTRSQTVDVRELIPEFFFLPEFLINGNRLHLGQRANGEYLNDIKLPPWAKDAREFVIKNRIALESPYVSAHLNHWIDLIWGCKQRGQAAVDSVNVFYYLTYEGQIDIQSIEDSLTRSAAIEQIKSFGQTPSQLFSKNLHPMRMAYPETPAIYLDYSRIKILERSQKSYAIGSISFVNDKVNFEKVNSRIISAYGQTTISWGIPDGSLRVLYGTSNDPSVIFRSMHRSTITACAISQDGSIIVTGGDDSMISVWNATFDDIDSFGIIDKRDRDLKLELAGYLHGHLETVSCLKLSLEFNIIASASKDQTVIVWDLNRLTCSFSITGFDSPIVDMSICSENGDLLVCTGTRISLWDLNGKFIATLNIEFMPTITCGEIISPVGILTESMPSNVILTGHEDGSISIWEVRMASRKEQVPDIKVEHSWGCPSHCWTIFHQRTLSTEIGHEMSISCISATLNRSGFWTADWLGHAIFWSISVEDQCEESIIRASAVCSKSVEDVRVLPCNNCLKKFKKAELRTPCKICREIYCSGCILDHIRNSESHSRRNL